MTLLSYLLFYILEDVIVCVYKMNYVDTAYSFLSSKNKKRGFHYEKENIIIDYLIFGS